MAPSAVSPVGTGSEVVGKLQTNIVDEEEVTPLRAISHGTQVLPGSYQSH